MYEVSWDLVGKRHVQEISFVCFFKEIFSSDQILAIFSVIFEYFFEYWSQGGRI